MTLDPATLAGKLLWLRAKDLVGTNGSPITTWPDQSGRGYDFTSSSSTDTVLATGVTPSGGKALTFRSNAARMARTGGVGPRVATAASSFATDPPGNAIDGNEASSFYTTNTNLPAGWLQVQWTTSFVCTGYSIRRRDSLPNRNIKDWTFEGSNNGSTWTVLDTRTGITWPTTGEVKTFTFTNAVAYSYYRVNFTANNGDSQYSSIAEITFAGDPTSSAEMWILVKVPGQTIGQAYTAAQFAPYSGSGDMPLHPNSTDQKVYESFGLASGGRQSFTPSLDLNNNWRLYRVANNSVRWRAWLDACLQATAVAQSIGWGMNEAVLGGSSGSTTASNFNGGSIAEVLIRDRVSTPSETTGLIDYFNTEHGLTVPSAPARPEIGTTLLLDSFDRPNSTNVPGSPQVGPAPTVLVGTIGISNSVIYPSAVVSNEAIVVWDLGTPDVEFTFARFSTSGFMGVVFCAASVTDYIYAELLSSALTLWRRNPSPGVAMTEVAASSASRQAGEAISMSMKSGVFRAFINDDEVMRYEVPNYVPSNRHGFRMTSANTNTSPLSVLVTATVDPLPGTEVGQIVSPEDLTITTPTLLASAFLYRGRDTAALDTTGVA